jgi:hypothetical protein
MCRNVSESDPSGQGVHTADSVRRSKYVGIDKYTKNKLCTKLVLFTRLMHIVGFTTSFFSALKTFIAHCFVSVLHTLYVYAIQYIPQ